MKDNTRENPMDRVRNRRRTDPNSRDENANYETLDNGNKTIEHDHFESNINSNISLLPDRHDQDDLDINKSMNQPPRN
jgi:hypothetical protein